ncbi:DNA repair protein RecO [Sphingomonas donggukensis]|uniref:DNA repair protein RecO n=1 Tax=Sphingomonas donggukensis TaxID=2949093 RepID=A0ABY4TZN6_9SPHN|nr:DNA repair protein RecO [Sphingomonas donggukensis]URW76011.1 DNA repair protein RecO [Sphingomonas donggukensis]
MHLRTPAIVLSIRAHGEHGAVVRALTPEHGLQAGYVRGGHGRRLRPVLQPGNRVLGEWRARTEDALPGLTVELLDSRAPLYAEPLAAAALDWTTALTAAVLPEGQSYPRLHAALDAVIDAIEAAPGARGWAVALVRYELLLLAELGFGLDLTTCVATGASDDLAFVSPKSSGAVSRAAATGYEARLMRLPPFLTAGGTGAWDDILAGLAITGHFLERDLLHGRAADALAARERLVDRIKRAVA